MFEGGYIRLKATKLDRFVFLYDYVEIIIKQKLIAGFIGV